jgi:phage terminase large subunit-like protein
MKAGRKPKLAPATLPKLRATTPHWRFAEFCRGQLRHVKGEWAGAPLVLTSWQMRDIVTPMFSTLRPDKRRQYRTVYVEIPRRNMKSTLAAAVALWLLLYDGEAGADVVSCASDKAQADIVFSIARAMVEQSETLHKVVQVYKRELVVPATRSTYRVISSESYSKHGLSLSGCIVDELHAHESRDLLDVMLTSMGSRRQPLCFIITTAGTSRDSVAWQFHEHAVEVRAGRLIDPAFLGVLYGAREDEDWRDPAVWQRANPGYDVSIKADYLRQECRRAQQMPSYENAFRRLHLNVWTTTETKWLDMAAWDAGSAPVDADALRGRRCYVGVDLSSTKDLSAVATLFPADDGTYDVLFDAWLPAAMFPDRVQRHGTFDAWAKQGFLHLTEGNVIDHAAIEARLRALGESYQVEAIAVDPWNATQLLAKLQADGLPALPQPQTIGALTGATKQLEVLVSQGKLRHGGHPLARWCAANATVATDHAENLKVSKQTSAERVDLIAALINALAVALPASRGSIYDSRDVVLVDL